MRILLVEDNLDLLALTKDNFEDLMVDCVTATSSVSTLEILEKDSDFDFIFSDITLNGINGIELSKIIKTKYNIPMILTSGDFVYSDLKNIDGFILKPYCVEEVFKSFHNYFNRIKQTNRKSYLSADF